MFLQLLEFEENVLRQSKTHFSVFKLYKVLQIRTVRDCVSVKSVGVSPPVEEAYRRLTSRQPERFWTSGQWMTERQGGSDVGQ